MKPFEKMEVQAGLARPHLNRLVCAALFFALVSFSPFRAFVPLPSPGEWLALLLIPIVCVLLLIRPADRQPLLAIPLIWAWLWMCASALFQPQADLVDHLKLPLRMAMNLAVFTAIFLWLRADLKHNTALLKTTLVWVALMNALVALVQKIIGPGLSIQWMPWGPEWTSWYSRAGFRTYGLLDNPLLAGCFLTIVLPLAWQDWFDARQDGERRAYAQLARGLMLLVGVLLTGSRSCILVAFAVSAWQLGRNLRYGRYLLLPALPFAGVVMIVVSGAGARFGALAESGGDANVQHRLAAWQSAFEMIADHPLFGVGPGQFANHYAGHYKAVLGQDHVSAMTVDNLLLQLTCELGLPFAVLGLLAFGCFFYKAWLIRTQEQGGTLVVCLGVFALLSQAVALLATPLMWLLFVMFALVAAVPKTGGPESVDQPPRG